MKLPLHISTHDRKLSFGIMGADSLASGAMIDIPGGATIVFEGAISYKAMGIPETLQFIVDLSIGIEVNLLAAWLYDKVKNAQVEQILICRRVIVHITQDEIRHVIEEEIRETR